MSYRRALVCLSILCVFSGCGEEQSAWFVTRRIGLGWVSNRTANVFDLCVTSDGTAIVPYIEACAKGPGGAPNSEAEDVKGRAAFIRKSRDAEFVDLTGVEQAQPMDPLSCSCAIDENDHTVVLLGLESFWAIEFDLHESAGHPSLKTRELPIPKDLVLKSLLIMKEKSPIGLVSASRKVEGERKGVVHGSVLEDVLTTLEVPLGGFFDATAVQDGVLIAGIARVSNGHPVVGFSKVAPRGGSWSAQPFDLPHLEIPGRIRGLGLICGRGEPVVLVASDFVLYECSLTDGMWDVAPIARENTVFSAFAAVEFRDAPCVVYGTYDRVVKLLLRDPVSGKWADYDLSSAFRQPVFEFRLAAQEHDRMLMVSCEGFRGQEGSSPPEGLVFREWHYRGADGKQEM